MAKSHDKKSLNISDGEIFDLAEAEAMKQANLDVLKVGECVCVADDEEKYEYTIVKILGKTADIQDTQDEDVVRSVALNSLYRPQIAIKIAMEMRKKLLSKLSN